MFNPWGNTDTFCGGIPPRMKRNEIGPFRPGLRRREFYSDALKNAFNAAASAPPDSSGGS